MILLAKSEEDPCQFRSTNDQLKYPAFRERNSSWWIYRGLARARKTIIPSLFPPIGLEVFATVQALRLEKAQVPINAAIAIMEKDCYSRVCLDRSLGKFYIPINLMATYISMSIGISFNCSYFPNCELLLNRLLCMFMVWYELMFHASKTYSCMCEFTKDS